MGQTYAGDATGDRDEWLCLPFSKQTEFFCVGGGPPAALYQDSGEHPRRKFPLLRARLEQITRSTLVLFLSLAFDASGYPNRPSMNQRLIVSLILTPGSSAPLFSRCSLRYCKALGLPRMHGPAVPGMESLLKSPRLVTLRSNPAALAVTRIDSADFYVGAPPPLGEGVQLWRIDLDAMAKADSRWQSILSPDERDRASRFHFERDRLHFCAARALLRTLLGGYLAAEPQHLRFRYSDKGKPELAEPHASSRFTFNLSHSGGVALIAITRDRPIGVDIEKIRDDFDTAAIAQRFFSAREQEQLLRLPPEEQHQAFFRCWTLKEAFIKALGEGLSHPLHQFDVSVDDEASVSLVTRPVASEAELWQLQSVNAGPGFAAAVAVMRR